MIRPDTISDRTALAEPNLRGVDPAVLPLSDDVTSAAGHVDLFGVRFPRATRDEALEAMLRWVDEHRTAAVAFPDMSTLNITWRQPAFRTRLRGRTTTFNDGAGLALAARLRRRRLPANLNGTDLCPELLAAAPAGTSLYLLGAAPGVAERAASVLAERHPHIRVVGHHHGYLDHDTEDLVVAELRDARPRIVMVGMGNPLQVEFIDRHLDDPGLAGTLWLAVGGQLDYYGGSLTRAPAWMVRGRLEWLYLVWRQPHKLSRYAVGIPLFLGRTIVAQLRGHHDAGPPPRRQGPATS